MQREVAKNPLALAILNIDQVLDRLSNLQDMLTKIQKVRTARITSDCVL